MAKSSLVGGVFVTLAALLAACGGAPGGEPGGGGPTSGATSTGTTSTGTTSTSTTSGPAEPSADCPYEDIPLDTASLPGEPKYPPAFFVPPPPPAPPPGAAEAPTPTEFQELREPPKAPENPMQGTVRDYQPLEIRYSDPNEKKIAGCGLTLRTYNGELVGPTLRVKPGQTLRFTVKNNLQSDETTPDSGEPTPDTSEPMPGMMLPDLDKTNLHAHGSQVDPDGTRDAAGNLVTASDNVLIEYGPRQPQQEQKYEIVVPEGHPSGTFWYHAHAHGSTAVQVSSGMAGALIVEDDNQNLNVPESDRSMLPESLKNIEEKTMIFQSILYDVNGRIADLNVANQNRTTWSESKRRITINGQLAPRITMRPGEVQRWRLVGATFEELLRLRLAEHDFNEIALDAHYLPRVDTWQPIEQHAVELQSGYRSDVLVKASTTPGTYMMVNVRDGSGRLPSPEATTVEPQLERVLAAVVVEGEPVPDRPLPTNTEMESIAYGWQDGQELTPLEDQWDPAKEPQKVDFNIDPNTGTFAINGRAYNSADPPRKLKLDQIDKWEISRGRGAHVFHIHTNPFQVNRIGPDGSEERVWKDSIVVPAATPENSNPVVMFTQYRTFVGRFVIHCHILDHEDDGMMQQVEVER